MHSIPFRYCKTSLMGFHLHNLLLGNLFASLPSSGVAAAVVTAGWYHTCAIVTGGSLMCWGFNDNGQLGMGIYSATGQGMQYPVMQKVLLGTGECTADI